MQDHEIAGGVLTTNHASSKDNRPVWVYQGQAYGPDDLDPRMVERHNQSKTRMGKMLHIPHSLRLMLWPTDPSIDCGHSLDQLPDDTPEILSQFLGVKTHDEALALNDGRYLSFLRKGGSLDIAKQTMLQRQRKGIEEMPEFAPEDPEELYTWIKNMSLSEMEKWLEAGEEDAMRRHIGPEDY
jgi:hypothetical protein